MDTLADISLLHIFSFLTPDPADLLSVRQVCRRWKELCELDVLWCEVNVHFSILDFQRENGINTSLPVRCVRTAPVLQTLSIDSLPRRKCFAVSQILRNRAPRKIKRLEFGFGSFSVDGFISITSHAFWENLQELSIMVEGWSDGDSSVWPVTLRQLPNLKKLSAVCEPVFEVADHPWPRLQELDLNYANMSGLGYMNERPSSRTLSLIQSSKNTITKFSIACVHDSELLIFLSNFYKTLALGFPHLTDLFFDSNLAFNFIKDNCYSCSRSTNPVPAECYLCQAFNVFEILVVGNPNLSKVGFNVDDLAIRSCTLQYEKVGNTIRIHSLTVRHECNAALRDILSLACNVNDGTNSVTFLRDVTIHARARQCTTCCFTGCDNFLQGTQVFMDVIPDAQFKFTTLHEAH